MRLSYMSKLSGPILDRIDLQIVMRPIDPRRMVAKAPAESTGSIAARVLKAREIQRVRLKGTGVFCNAGMNSRMLEQHCPLNAESRTLLEKIIGQMDLSARACHRIIKIARTIADLAGKLDISPEHIAEASGYRILDRHH